MVIGGFQAPGAGRGQDSVSPRGRGKWTAQNCLIWASGIGRREAASTQWSTSSHHCLSGSPLAALISGRPGWGRGRGRATELGGKTGAVKRKGLSAQALQFWMNLLGPHWCGLPGAQHGQCSLLEAELLQLDGRDEIEKKVRMGSVSSLVRD